MHRIFHSRVFASIATTCVVACVIAPPARAKEDPRKQYKIEARIYGFKLEKGEIVEMRAANVTAERVSIGPDAQRSPIHFFGNASFKTKHFSFQIDDGEIRWLGPQPADPVASVESGTHQTGQPDARYVTTIAEPTLLTSTGEQAQIKIVQAVQWFERRDNGTFVLRSTDAGCTISCTATPQDSEYVRVDWESRVKCLSDREQIPDVQLPIGAPILSTDALNMSNLVKTGTWYGILNSTNETGFMLNLIRVTETQQEKP